VDWQADAGQQARIDVLRDWALTAIPRIWDFATRLENGHLKPPLRFRRADEDDLARYRQTLDELRQSLGEDQRGLAEFFCFPLARGLPLDFRWKAEPGESVRFHCQAVLHQCLARYLHEHADNYALDLLWGRLSAMLRHPIEGETVEEAHRRRDEAFYDPNPRTVGRMLVDQAPVADYPEHYRALLRGDWCVDIPAREYQEATTSYAAQAYQLRQLFQAGLAYLRARDEFSYEDFQHLLNLAPDLAPASLLTEPAVGENDDDEDEDDRRLAAFKEDTRRHAWEKLSALSEDETSIAPLEPFRYTHPSGGRWLLKVCELVDSGQVPASALVDDYEDLSRTLTGFAGIAGLAADETEEALVEALRAFAPATLWRVLPFAGAGRRAVLKALDQDKLLGVHDWVFRTAGSDPHQPGDEPSDIPNCESTTLGVVDQEALARALEGVPNKAIDAYAKALKQSKLPFKHTLQLLLAFQGRNTATLEKSVARHAQAAIRAYGLLPVADKTQAAERYTTLKRIWKECAKYGAERQANTRAAVTAGLANLAARAGYRDAARMEWDLEAELGENAMAMATPRPMGDWEVSLTMEGIKPVLQVSKQGKPLKSVPAGLRKVEGYAELKEAQAKLKEQASRFRRTLEQMMVDAEWIELTDLARLAKIPAVQALLVNLIGIDGADKLGLIDPLAAELVDGETCQPMEARLRIAHVHDLYQRGVLSHWQQAIVQAQRVQPFKQAFRELYLLTAAEETTGDHSNRFAGHTVNTAIAYRLLQSRGWSFVSSDVAEVYKRFPAEKLLVEWEFPEARHFFSEEEQLPSDKLVFYRRHERVPLAEIPPLMFSEVMRDADLVVSVANASEDSDYWSAETQAARASVVSNIVQQLGLKRASVEDQFVFVEGKLARYRIHMGSGNIHIVPGNYLCIVPENKTKSADKLYLPFADTDAKTSEVISKILLLHNDQRIKDETILSQIRRTEQG